MHDPMTQILHIPHLGILWHVDPERGGDDDSCSWSGRTVTLDEADWLRKEGAGEYKFFFGATHEIDGFDAAMRTASTTEVVHAVWQIIEWRMPRRESKRPYLRWLAGWRMMRRMQAAMVEIMSLGGNVADNFGHVVAEARESAEGLGEMFFLVGRARNRHLRPWWKHPRWHVHHWRLQVFLLQNLKRWLFTRCASCGGRFKLGETGVGGWNSDGPRWFRSESLRHCRCADPAAVRP